MKTIVFILICTLNLFGNRCADAYEKVDPAAKKYPRIDYHIREHNSSCDVVYAYSVFLKDSGKMDELEEDNTYAENLGKFAKNYPYTAKFIINKETFDFFNRYYSRDKNKINNAIKRVFEKEELTNKKNLSYIMLAISMSEKNFDEKNLYETLKDIKQRYSLDDLSVIVPFWELYKKKYFQHPDNLEKIKQSFEHTVDIYGISLLKKYSSYINDFYPTLLPEKHDNDIYKNTIKSMLGEPSGVDRYTVYFLKNISIDIEIALANGNSKEEILYYFKPFIMRDFETNFKKASCDEKEGMAMLVADNLDNKLDWIRSEAKVFENVIRELSEENDRDKIMNILGLYSYASTVYAEMNTPQQKEMFSKIINLPAKNSIFNLSLIYALDNNTTYFDAIKNNPDTMYIQEKYNNILYVSRNDKTILNLFRDGDARFLEEINDLVKTSPDNINDMTIEEIRDRSIKVVEYADWATIIIPGVGVGYQIAKVLAKTSIKAIIKTGANKTLKNTYKFTKKQIRNAWNDKIRYTGKPPIDNPINRVIGRSAKIIFPIAVVGMIYDYFYDEEQEYLCTGDMQ